MLLFQNWCTTCGFRDASSPVFGQRTRVTGMADGMLDMNAKPTDTISVRDVFGIDTDMTIKGFAEGSDRVPEKDPTLGDNGRLMTWSPLFPCAPLT